MFVSPDRSFVLQNSFSEDETLTLMRVSVLEKYKLLLKGYLMIESYEDETNRSHNSI